VTDRLVAVTGPYQGHRRMTLTYLALARRDRRHHQLFAREDSVEEIWRIMQPLLEHPPDVLPYPRGSWGPEVAETLHR
jgi:glucose-6-phosphate 1-dehydrogenase